MLRREVAPLQFPQYSVACEVYLAILCELISRPSLPRAHVHAQVLEECCGHLPNHAFTVKTKLEESSVKKAEAITCCNLNLVAHKHAV